MGYVKGVEPSDFTSTDTVIHPEEINILTIIGEGTTAVVYKATRDSRNVVAVKEITSKQANFLAAERELCMLSLVVHPNVLRLYGLVQGSSPLRIVLEYCEGGSLFDLLHCQRKVELIWSQNLKMLSDTASALSHLHNLSPQIIHRDLKSLNLMLLNTVDGMFVRPHIKLADFGFARLQDKAMTQGVGTKHWMAPEVLSGTGYTVKADIFSFGMVAYEVICRHVPYQSLKPEQVARKTVKGERPVFDNYVDVAQVPDGLLALTSACWGQRPESRPPAAEIFARLVGISSRTSEVIHL